MKVYGPEDQPYKTDNSILAFALYLASVSFCDDKWPCVNHYTIEQLKGFGYDGLLPQEAAIQAVKDHQKGTTEYLFKAPDAELIKAYIDQKTMLEQGEGLARDVVKNLLSDLVNGARTQEETVVRLICTIVYMRAEFLEMWTQLEPLIQLDVPLEQTEQVMPDGSKVVTVNGFQFIGAYASEETKQHMGLC